MPDAEDGLDYPDLADSLEPSRDASTPPPSGGPDEAPITATQLGALQDLLQDLLLSTDTIEEFLDGLTAQAVSEVNEAAGDALSCGITVRRARRKPATVGSSDGFAVRLDESQYAAGVGPCLEALDTGEVQLITDAATETRWAPYLEAARGQGLGASLSVPITARGELVGALNLYSRRARTFDAPERDRAAGFAAQAGGALAVALRLAERTDHRDDLAAALTSRSSIDQALGILMGQRRINAEDAYAALVELSQQTNVKLRRVAAFLIENVTGEPPRPPQRPH